jgi:hypothetical protein
MVSRTLVTEADGSEVGVGVGASVGTDVAIAVGFDDASLTTFAVDETPAEPEGALTFCALQAVATNPTTRRAAAKGAPRFRFPKEDWFGLDEVMRVWTFSMTTWATVQPYSGGRLKPTCVWTISRPDGRLQIKLSKSPLSPDPAQPSLMVARGGRTPIAPSPSTGRDNLEQLASHSRFGRYSPRSRVHGRVDCR